MGSNSSNNSRIYEYERDVLRDVRLALGAEPGCVFWRNQVGRYRKIPSEVAIGTPSIGGMIPYGLCKGSSDLIGFVTVLIDGMSFARFAALECKSARGKLSAEQEKFLTIVVRSGGIGAVVRSAKEALDLVRGAKRGRV